MFPEINDLDGCRAKEMPLKCCVGPAVIVFRIIFLGGEWGILSGSDAIAEHVLH